ncbi:MAG TPA: M48 family metallopeptidase [Vicinamibacteria bacterium]|nr:M48 family metallopeptidase [Vicinamibacteria bacterium]
MKLIRNSMYASRCIAAFCVLVVTATPAVAQTDVHPGFNLFSTEQEVEIGRQSAREIESKLPALNDSNVVHYIEELGSRLVQQAPGADYPYSFRVLDVADVNAFALPGGYIYLNRGLIEAVRNEGELAGVLAHEIGHVALRHSTNQLSKDYLAQAGLSVLGGLIGDGTASQILDVVGVTGVSLLFLKFSRTAEEQADTVGAQMMARAGYDPLALASFFSRLESESRGAPPEFLSSHPNYASRRQNIQHEASLLDPAPYNPVGDLSHVQARLDDMRPAPTMAALLEEEGSTEPPRNPGGNTSGSDIGNNDWERPSSRFVEHTQRNQYYRIDHPDNWRVHAGDDGFAVTIAPNGGILRTGSGRQEIIVGALVNHYTRFSTTMTDRSRRSASAAMTCSTVRRARCGTQLGSSWSSSSMAIRTCSPCRTRCASEPSTAAPVSGRSSSAPLH